METNFLQALQAFFQIPLDRPELPPAERNLYRASAAFLFYTPMMLVFGFFGLVLIYVIALLGLLDNPDPKLLAVAGVSLLFILMQLPLFPYAKRGEWEVVIRGLLICSILSGITQVLWWGPGFIIWLFTILLIILPTLTFVYLMSRIRKQYRIWGLVGGIVATIIVFYLDSVVITYPRMDFSSLSQVAGFTVDILVITALVALSVISVFPFRSISSRLIATFAFVAVLSAISILVISSLAGFFQDRRLAINQLKTVSNFKLSQIDDSLSDLERSASFISQDQTIAQKIDFLLNNPPDALFYQSNFLVVTNYFKELQKQNTKFDEILILDQNGKVILSTLEKNLNKDFSQSPFFLQALNGQTISLESNFPGANENFSLLVVRPLLTGGSPKGILAIRSNLDEIEKIMQAGGGLGDGMQTYLVASVAGKNVPITKIQGNATEIDILTIQKATSNKNGWGTYNNYQGIRVFVYYAWYPKIGVSLITEIEEAKVAQNAIALLFTNLLVSLFIAALAFAIIYITSQSISNPIINLAKKANALATGEMGTRITIDREDEIGGLSSSFNVMAEQLQNLVRTLEEKVEDRTQGLQIQANRLLLAAEIARDAAALGDLDELLNRSSRLVLDRFNFYHTGIFLIDQQRDYAILRASPTEAGSEMIKQNHRLRIGKEGIVGNVAASGEARVVADTSRDISYLNNPLLPRTRSELALPLKVEARVIGVLDVQSETPNAFTPDDIVVLQIMADQLALAIERVQLVEQLEGRLGELEHAYQQFTVTSWQDFSRQPDFKAGYNFDGIKLSAIDSFPLWSQDALRRGRPVILPGKTTDSKDSLLGVPLKLRGQIIGVLNIRFTGDTLNTETINLSEEIANRLAVALENARLYTETQKLAQQERAVSEISTRITTSINIENILRTAVQELGRMMPDAEVTVQLQEEKEE
jgi:GAF domain-containing protein/HAMP domain-containing protein